MEEYRKYYDLLIISGKSNIIHQNFEKIIAEFEEELKG